MTYCSKLKKFLQNICLDGEGRKDSQVRENDEDGPLSKALESRGSRMLWVIFVVHKIDRLGWDLECLNQISERFRSKTFSTGPSSSREKRCLREGSSIGIFAKK